MTSEAEDEATRLRAQPTFPFRRVFSSTFYLDFISFLGIEADLFLFQHVIERTETLSPTIP